MKKPLGGVEFYTKVNEMGAAIKIKCSWDCGIP